MVLTDDVLARSVVHAGSAAAWAPVFARLDAGEPLVLGVFGASVAQVCNCGVSWFISVCLSRTSVAHPQNGGCLDQPYKRCMRYDGVHSTFMRWGTPRVRPFKGFAVRLLEHINSSHPNARHQINNSALDATPAQSDTARRRAGVSEIEARCDARELSEQRVDEGVGRVQVGAQRVAVLVQLAGVLRDDLRVARAPRRGVRGHVELGHLPW